MHFIDPTSQPEAPVPQPVAAPPEYLIERPPAEVDLLDALVVAVVSFLALVICSLIASIIYLAAHAGQGLNPANLEKALARNAYFLVPTQFAAYLLVVGAMALLVWGRHKRPLAEAIHWNFPGLHRAFYAVGGGLALALFSEVAEALLQRWIPKSLPMTEYFKDRPSALLLAGFGVLVAPLVEEMMFRGFLYPALARRTGSLISILLTSAGFALLHGAQLSYSWAPLLVIFLVGVALTTTRAVTKSVATCVIVHAAYNFVLFALTYFATHGFRQMQE